jgi:hypothetical protein
MALQFKPGDQVRQVVTPIQGEVVGVAIVDADVQFEVKWTDAAGTHTRFFTGEQIEATPAPV